MTRHEARVLAFSLVFEREFNSDKTLEELYEIAKETREFEDDDYVKDVYFGTAEHEGDILTLVEKHSQSWKINRISKISITIIKVAVYEMLYTDIPLKVTLNEAVEISKEYDDEKASAFVNGVLNSIARGVEEKSLND